MSLSRFLSWLMPATQKPGSAGSAGSPPSRRLFVDVSTIVRHDARTGIQRVVRSVCRELGGLAGDDVAIYPVAATKRRAYRVVQTDLIPADRQPAVKGALRLGEGDVFLGLDLCAHLFTRHEGQLAQWRSDGAEIAVVVYDLLPAERPEWFNPQTAHHFRRWLGVVGRQATQAFPISRTVQSNLAAYLATHHADRVRQISSHVLPLSGDIGLFDPDDEAAPDPVVEAMQSRPAILMVGTIEPRKGHAVALAAHRHAWRTSPDTAPLLIVAGKPGWRTEDLQGELRTLELDRDGAIWLESVCDAQLDRLYRACCGVLVASFGEGYCLPLHEAQSYGKPVLARDLPVLRELETPTITYFSGDDPASLAAELLRFASRRLETPSYPDSRGWTASVLSLADDLKLTRAA